MPEMSIKRTNWRVADKGNRCDPNVVHRYRGALLTEHFIQHRIFLAYDTVGRCVFHRGIGEKSFQYLQMMSAGTCCEIKTGAELSVNGKRDDKSIEPSKNLRQIVSILQEGNEHIRVYDHGGACGESKPRVRGERTWREAQNSPPRGSKIPRPKAERSSSRWEINTHRRRK